jgi:hypothetical protein
MLALTKTLSPFGKNCRTVGFELREVANKHEGGLEGDPNLDLLNVLLAPKLVGAKMSIEESH